MASQYRLGSAAGGRRDERALTATGPFLRPTRVTWLVFALPFVTGAVAVAFQWDWPFLPIYLFALEVPFRLWSALGVPVGRHTDFWGWPDPNAAGVTLIAVTDMTIWYVVASLVAAAWRAVWHPRRDAVDAGHR
jgi:hypothetical protein